MIPEVGQIAQIRSRPYLVEDVREGPTPGHDTLVRLSCLDHDALGEPLEVLWEKEVDARIHGRDAWETLATRGFDDPKLFGAYLDPLRWNCVTSTDANLFQSPSRAGIEVKAYQLEPLRKALRLPRVNLFIADDVGLGKTIEAGLILRELLIRHKVRRVVIAAPPSVVRQWQQEMEQRFGLTFVIYDRQFVADKRRQRGFSINPFHTHSRFIISHALLRNETYAAPLRDWLGDFSAGSLLILDEAHHAAPSSSGKYAVSSKFTRSIRDLSRRFEHRLFLSATPHNGHSNSFAALLEILDPQRFIRGVPVTDHRVLDEVMVRRLKKDLRGLDADFPERRVLRHAIEDLPADAPELRLSELLEDYRQTREQRTKSESRSRQAAVMLVTTSLQKRLLSSIEAFAHTLTVHARSVRKAAAKVQSERPEPPRQVSLLEESPGADDERGDVSEDEVQAEEDAQLEAATAATAGPAKAMDTELAIIDQMLEIANSARAEPDPRVIHLLGWIRENMCSELGEDGAAWNRRRVVIFTEYADTKRYLEEQLRDAIRTSDRAPARLATFHGGIGDERRERIKAAFNTDPDQHPLRILIATDAAREGVNLQNHCADLFHFDIPWNPSRMEQRNGRIDRKLQRAKAVRCHYYVFPQRTEDRVLEVLLKKTETIRTELGSLSPVVELRLEKAFELGIPHAQLGQLTGEIETADGGEATVRTQVIQDELETVREARVEELKKKDVELRQLLEKSYEWLNYRPQDFRGALSAALEHMGAEPLRPRDASEAADDPERARWVIPALHERLAADPTWASTLDTLREPMDEGQKPWEWRREAPIRPVVFRDPGCIDQSVVHLHLEHRVVQRLLGRFLAAGFQRDDMRRSCVVRTESPVPKVILIARLSLYGDGAARLHDNLVPVAAEWVDPQVRKKKLKALAKAERDDVLDELERGLRTPHLREVSEKVRDSFALSSRRDIEELIPMLERRVEQAGKRIARVLEERGEREAKAMVTILTAQRERILREKAKADEQGDQLTLELDEDAKRERLEEMRHWERRLPEVDEELQTEPERIRNTYRVRAQRLEPVGLCYLWPLSS